MSGHDETRSAWRAVLAEPRVLVLLALVPVAAGAAVWTGSAEAAVWVLAASLAAGGCPACALLRGLGRRGGACARGERGGWTPPPGI